MPRWAILLILALATTGTAFGADMPARGIRHGDQSPPAKDDDDDNFLLKPFKPNGFIPYVPPLAGKPFLLGSSTIPGYYGSSHSYDYQGPYYGGPNIGYWNRLPYDCGVYGYC